MITSLEDLHEAVGHDEEKKVTNQNREDWNKYIGFLQKRGIAGKPELDKNNLGKNLLATYIKENPTTSLTTDLVIPIQKDFANYRQWSLDQIKQGKGAFGEGVNEDNYLRSLSIVDGIPGQRTTSFSYPNSYLKTLEDGKVVNEENKGLINTSNPVLPK